MKHLRSENLDIIETNQSTEGDKKEPYNFYLPTAFAVRGSEPKLAHAINNCLRILKANGYVYIHLKSRYKSSLGDKVQWEDELSRTASQIIENHNNPTSH
jgi:hypothetical protein